MFNTRKLRLAIAGSAALAALMVAVSAASAGSAGCGSAFDDEPISESQEFTPAELQRSRMFDSPLPDGTPPENSALTTEAGFALNALPPAQLEFVETDGSVYTYFLDQTISDMTISDFIEQGGVQVYSEPALSTDSFASYLSGRLGDRVVTVAIGNYEAALVWADPNANGTRTHNLYWGDGENDYSLIADLAPEAIVDLGRTLVCDG